MKRLAARIVPLSLAMVATLGARADAQTAVEADEVMAAFVYRFPQFVEWPAAALAGRGDLEICVAEPGPFVVTLQRLVEGESLDGRPLTLRSVLRSRDVDGCHVLYLSEAADQPDALLREAAERPVLTVGTGPDFLDDGGIIQLMVIDRRIRFEVSSAAAARAGLRLSSQLLDLAVAVRGGPE